ncbi:MAG: RNA polymerase sigma factor [Vampirovibrionales bacterium]|nr:RNA polymerase sigma factor [Vampirovibrionales bacterium]
MTLTPNTLNPLSQATDASLVDTCLSQALSEQKANQAFRELTVRYSRLVYHFVYKMTNNKELAEDITQDVFLKAYQNLGRFDQSRPFKPWLMRIASNTTISALRKTENALKSQPLSLDVLAEQGLQLGESSGGFPEIKDSAFIALSHEPDQLRQLEQSATAEEIKATLARLDAKYRQILILRYFEDLSYEEISQSLGIPLNTVRTWIRRGLEKFKNQFAESKI